MPARTSLLGRLLLVVTFAIASTVIASAGPISGNQFKQTNLVSDLLGVAATTDPDLVNPWGIATSSSSPFWISDNGTGLSTLYNSSGTKLGLVVSIPSGLGIPSAGDPTGVVFNGNAADFGGNRFIFANESGVVTGWTSGTTAQVVAFGNPGSIYKGIAIAGDNLLVANFGRGTIDVFNSSLSLVSSAGFTDPTLPSGYAPFNIENIGGKIYVTYAATSGGTDEQDGPGLGFVDVYDTNGTFMQRLVSQGALNAPWGMAMAPAGFGKFGGDLLVGNFGDGTINAFDPTTGVLQGTLSDMNGNPIVNEGLWGLTFGNGGNGGNPDKLYFTAGIPGPDLVEDHGLFASLSATPEPTSVVLVGVGLIGVWRLRKR